MNMKKARLDAGLTQKEMAEMFGIPLDTVKSWDAGRRNPPEWAGKLLLEKLEKLKKEREEKIMTKFEIRKNTREVKSKQDVMPGCTLDQADCEDKLIASFDNKDDALEALKTYTTSVSRLSGYAGTYYSVTEYYVQENLYDEDGDFTDGGDIWEFSRIEEEEEEEEEEDED